jgi:hypothetical protein
MSYILYRMISSQRHRRFQIRAKTIRTLQCRPIRCCNDPVRRRTLRARPVFHTVTIIMRCPPVMFDWINCNKESVEIFYGTYINFCSGTRATTATAFVRLAFGTQPSRRQPIAQPSSIGGCVQCVAVNRRTTNGQSRCRQETVHQTTRWAETVGFAKNK